MSSSSSDILFESVIQPFKLAQITTCDLEAISIDKKPLERIEPPLPLKKEGEKIDVPAKMTELLKLERNNLKLLKDIYEILSIPEFQKIFEEIEVKAEIFTEVMGALKTYCDCAEKYYPSNSSNSMSDEFSQIGLYYSPEFLFAEKSLILFFPDLVFLCQMLTHPHHQEKIKTRLNRQFENKAGKIGENDEDIQDVIKKGQLFANIMRRLTHRELILQGWYVAIPADHPDALEIERVYKEVRANNLFAKEMMEKARNRREDINRHPYCLRKVLCNKEYFSVLEKMAEEDEETTRALIFLRDLSLLIDEESFLNNTIWAQFFAIKALGIAINTQQMFEDLIPTIEEKLSQIRPLLVRFVHSDAFKQSADLLKRENEMDYQKRLNEVAQNGGELIVLYKETLNEVVLKEEERKESIKEEGKVEDKGKDEEEIEIEVEEKGKEEVGEVINQQEVSAIQDPDNASLRAPFALHYLSVAAKKVGDFVDAYPDVAMTIGVLSCLAVGIGIGILTGGVGLALGVAGSVSAVGLWCGIFWNSTSKGEDTQKQLEFAQNMMAGYDLLWCPTI